MDVPFYQTVTRAKLATTGYIRIDCGNINAIPKEIKKLCCKYFGSFFPDPNKDASNFISKEDMEKASELKQSGNKLIKMKNYEKALEKYTESLSYNINDSKTRSNRCLCYLKLNQYDKALCDARFAIINEPLSYKAWLRLAQTFECMQQYRECENIIWHSIQIVESHDDNDENDENEKEKTLHILCKYWTSIKTKREEFEQLNPDKVNINHMNDEDRLEWKHCENGLVDENKISDDELLDLMPWRIQSYLQMITPTRLAKQIENDMDITDEYERWMDRKWIKKLYLFETINFYKLLLNNDIPTQSPPFKFKSNIDFIANDVAMQPFEDWTISWSAGNGLYLNKRWFTITIGSAQSAIFYGGTYCKPNSKELIKCIILSILSPSDTFMQITQQLLLNGLDRKSDKHYRKPQILSVQYRMKDEFDDIRKVMNLCGIRCRLLSLEDNIESCKKYGTNPYGWNYLDLEPYYKYDIDNI